MKHFPPALSAVLLLPLSAVHGDKGGSRIPRPTSSSKRNTVLIGTEEVDLDYQLMAGDGEVTLLVTAENNEGDEFARLSGAEPAIFPSSRHFHLIKVGADEADKRRNELLANPNIRRVEVDQRVDALPIMGSPGGLRRLAEEEPYGIGMVLEDVEWWKAKFDSDPPTGSSKVCVVDTGYGNGHPDLPLLDQTSDGFNPYDEGEWYIDGHSHGTHCAGTIGALGSNDIGIVGVIPSSLSNKFSFFIGKGLMDDFSGTSAGVLTAVQKCVDNGANVITMPLGVSNFSKTFDEACYGHYKNDDVLIIAAAGNSGDSSPLYPASYASVMSVAAVDSSENKASVSQYNDQTEIAGPGVGVKSTVTGNQGVSFGYSSYSGTSTAAPHVAGVAALLRMYFPDCRAFQIRRAMIRTAKDKGDPGCDVNFGHGIVKAKQAFEYLEMDPCVAEETFKEPVGGCREFECSVYFQCNDGDPRTIDKCVDGACVHACGKDADCDDGRECSRDACNEGKCFHDFESGYPVVTLELTTDNYPKETGWNLKQGDITLSEGGDYSDAKTYTEEFCFDQSISLTFTITDEFGDGMCCSYGQGGYVVKVNGVEVARGGEFEDSETHTFDVAMPAPTSEPTPPPTPPACDICDDRETEWMIENRRNCTQVPNLIDRKCKKNSKWKTNKNCRLSCFRAGNGYDGDECCEDAVE